ncbi:MAG: Rrf2 family transcriptional regulator [Cyclobacteriaceae bacterium]|nr:Rrf2 family transcriptional regulator [Cyclobacteriaceae bacterium]
MFSKACEYGIRASIYMVGQSLLDKKVSLKEVAMAIDSPVAYTSKILQQLSRNNIINSEKGPTGGYFIDKLKLEEIKLSTIVSAIDGDTVYEGCGLGLQDCDQRKPCSIHNQFKLIRRDLKQMLETTTLLALSNENNNGITFLKR